MFVGRKVMVGKLENKIELNGRQGFISKVLNNERFGVRFDQDFK
jgi:hypothetical protein